MEGNQIAGIVMTLVLIGSVCAVGLILLDKLATATKVSRTITNESVTVTATLGTLANNDLTAFSALRNGSSNTVPSSSWNYSLKAGTIKTNHSGGAGTFYADYVYDSDAQSTSGVLKMLDALYDIPNLWVGLLVTVIVLGIVMAVLFKAAQGRL